MLNPEFASAIAVFSVIRSLKFALGRLSRRPYMLPSIRLNTIVIPLQRSWSGILTSSTRHSSVCRDVARRNILLSLFLVAAMVCCCLPLFPVFAEGPTIAGYVPQAALVGRARFSFFIWDVYDAELYAPGGVWQESRPFALSLRYHRELSGKAIARRSREEIERQGAVDSQALSRWEAQMEEIFPDVGKNTVLTGVRDNEGRTVFYRDKEKIGEISDSEFTKYFFSIWLGAATSEPELREQLLNLKRGS